jgi:hypothetical protein
MSSNENLDLQLSKGSVWMRKDGSQVKFLFLTNLTLSPKTQEDHPPQVIYTDVEGNVYNRDVDKFLKVYQFYNVDGELEQRLNRLIVFNPADYSTLEDEDDAVIQITDDGEDEDSLIVRAPATTNSDETLAEQMLRELTASNEEPTHLSVSFAISQNPDLRMPKLTAEDLSQAVVLYSNSPNEQYDLTEHKLLFPLEGNITEESLREVFHPSTEVNTVDYFTVLTKFRRDEIVWDAWIGIVPEYSVNGLYAAVLVGTANKTLDTAPTPGVEAVELGPVATQPVVSSAESEFDPATILAAQETVAGAPEAAVEAPAVVTEALIPAEVAAPTPAPEVVETPITIQPQPVPQPIVIPVVPQAPVVQVMAQ